MGLLIQTYTRTLQAITDDNYTPIPTAHGLASSLGLLSLECALRYAQMLINTD